MTAGWSLERGAKVLERDVVRFSVWAPRAEQVSVRVCSGIAAGEHPLTHQGNGVFETVVEGITAGTDYFYCLTPAASSRPDCLLRPDPVSRWQPHGVHGPSRVVDPAAFRWTDAGWTGLEMADLAIYELHVGTFTEAGTFASVIERLRELRALGITAIELMPVAEFPGARNWGYDGAHPFAPQSTYGGPEELRRLVDEAHRAELAVILDAVYNHLGPEGNYLGAYGPYFTDAYRTPWGAAINYCEADCDEVRRYFVDNALYWITEFHIDALRLDAVHGIYDFGARHILGEIAGAVHQEGARLGRRTLVIAESDLNDPRLVREPERGGLGLDAQWSDDFHHAVHALLTGERNGYYADFGGVTPLTKAIERRFVYDGAHSVYRRRRHGAPAPDVPSDRFVICLQNHDQVGNRAHGERLATLLSFEQLKLAAALLLLSPYVPLLFMGEEYGETSPFQYFVSHGDPALVEAVRVGRRLEFEAFGSMGDVPDPQAEETFLRSRLDRTLPARPGHAELLTLYRDLLQLRREEPAFRPGNAQVDVASDAADEWITVCSTPPAGAALLAAFNLSARAREVPVPGIDGSCWRLQLTTEDPRYGGTRRQEGAQPAPRISVPAHAALLLRQETD